jgi:hypothetical protein
VTTRPTARHKADLDREPRSSALRRRLLRGAPAVVAAVLITAAAVGTVVTRGQFADRTSEVAARPTQLNVPAGGRDASIYRADRPQAFSRSADRVTLQQKPDVKAHLYRTAPLNLWPQPKEKGRPLTVLAQGGKVAATGVRKGGFAQILYAGQVRWVNQHYLSAKKPVPPSPAGGSSSGAAPATGSPAPGGVSFAPCPDGSATESGLTSSAVRLYRAVCNAFPALTTYGGYSAHGEHSSGKAIDFMINGDSGLGQAIADWARAHAAELNLYDVIWQQHIWTPVRSSEGWRAMPDRGSPTANHMDHVHISVN